MYEIKKFIYDSVDKLQGKSTWDSHAQIMRIIFNFGEVA
jgi:hypothetical protein